MIKKKDSGTFPMKPEPPVMKSDLFAKKSLILGFNLKSIVN